MADLASYTDRPFAFLLAYMRRRAGMHAGLFLAVIAAALCQVSTQYGIKFLVDTLSLGRQAGGQIWLAFALLISMIAGDNLLWRLAGQFGSRLFVLVTGDLRDDLFRYVTGHAPSYFADRLPGTLASRITAAANAVFTMENMFAWNLVPPVMVIAGAIVYLSMISLAMTAGLVAAAGLMVLVLFRFAAAGKPLHRRFAETAAAWMDYVVQSFDAAVAAGDVVAMAVEPAHRFRFVQQMAMALRLSHLPQRPAFEYAGSKRDLTDQAVLFALRGLGLTDRALARYYQPRHLQSTLDALFT